MTDNLTNDIDDLINNFQVHLKVSKENKMPNTNEQNVSLNMLKMFVDTIPPYDGDVNTLNSFISASDFLFVNYGNTNDHIIKNYLIRVVQTKLIHRAQILVGSRAELTSWDLIKSALKQCFADKRNLECLEQDLFMASPYKGEKPLEFGKRLQVLRSNLAQKISNETMNALSKEIHLRQYDQLCLRTFIRGLPPQLQCLIRLKNPASPEDAMTPILLKKRISNTRKIHVKSTTRSRPPILD